MAHPIIAVSDIILAVWIRWLASICSTSRYWYYFHGTRLANSASNWTFSWNPPRLSFADVSEIGAIWAPVFARSLFIGNRLLSPFTVPTGFATVLDNLGSLVAHVVGLVAVIPPVFIDARNACRWYNRVGSFAVIDASDLFEISLVGRWRIAHHRKVIQVFGLHNEVARSIVSQRPGIVMHDTGVIVWNAIKTAFGIRHDSQLEVGVTVVFRESFWVDSDVLVAVVSRLFVMQANAVEQFVNNDSMNHASIRTQRNQVFAFFHAHARSVTSFTSVYFNIIGLIRIWNEANASVFFDHFDSVLYHLDVFFREPIPNRVGIDEVWHDAVGPAVRFENSVAGHLWWSQNIAFEEVLTSQIDSTIAKNFHFFRYNHWYKSNNRQ